MQPAKKKRRYVDKAYKQEDHARAYDEDVQVRTTKRGKAIAVRTIVPLRRPQHVPPPTEEQNIPEEHPNYQVDSFEDELHRVMPVTGTSKVGHAIYNLYTMTDINDTAETGRLHTRILSNFTNPAPGPPC